MFNKEVFFIGMIIFTFAIGNSFSQEPIDQLLWGDDLFIVTASKKQEHANEAPATVVVITKKMIEKRGYRDLKDIFNDLPGFDVSTNVYGEFSTLVTQRGIGGNNKIVILLNGERITSPSGRQFAFGNNVPVYNLKKIEVVYGPASALYGADAFGVINMVTESSDSDTAIFADLTAGQNGTRDLFLQVNHAINKDVSIDGFFRKYSSDSGDLSKDYEDLQVNNHGITKYGYETPIDDWNGFLNLQVKNLSLGLNFSDYHEQLSKGLVPDHYVYRREAYWGNTSWQAFMKHQYTSGKFRFNSAATFSKYEIDPEMSWHYIDRDNCNELPPVHQYGVMTKYELGGQLDYDFTDRLNLIIGASIAKVMGLPTGDKTGEPFDQDNPLKLDNYYNNTFPQTAIQATDNAIYLQFRLGLTDRLRLMAGARSDYNSSYGRTNNPRLGLVYNSDRTSLKLMAGTAYIAPGYFQRYESWFTTEYGHVQNLELKPEQMTTIEANWTQHIGARLKTSASIYYNKVTDLIVKKSGGLTQKVLPEWIERGGGWIDADSNGEVLVQRYENFGEVKSYGFDLTTNYVLEHPSINLFASYSFMDGHNSDPESGDKLDLFKTSKYKVTGGLTWSPIDKIHITPRIRWVSEIATRRENSKYGVDRDGDYLPESKLEKMPGYHLVNLTVVGNELVGNLGFHLNVANLLNQKYYTSGVATEGSSTYLPRVPQELLTVTAGVNYRF